MKEVAGKLDGLNPLEPVFKPKVPQISPNNDTCSTVCLGLTDFQCHLLPGGGEFFVRPVVWLVDLWGGVLRRRRAA